MLKITYPQHGAFIAMEREIFSLEVRKELFYQNARKTTNSKYE